MFEVGPARLDAASSSSNEKASKSQATLQLSRVGFLWDRRIDRETIVPKGFGLVVCRGERNGCTSLLAQEIRIPYLGTLRNIITNTAAPDRRVSHHIAY